MLSVAIPVIYLNQQMFSNICPLSEAGGIPIHDSCFAWTNAVLFLTGLLVNGPYALITTAVSAELGKSYFENQFEASIVDPLFNCLAWK